MRLACFCLAFAAALFVPSVAAAVDLYTNNFESDTTGNWVMNGGPVDEPGTGLTDGDNRAFFFFDYSTVGIPKAPNSAVGDSTRGMKLQANMDANSDGIATSATVTGMSVSPTGVDISAAGDFRMTFDLWGNFPGPFPAGSSGTSQMSTFGYGTTGAFPNYPGSADGVWFAATVDGGSTSDYRVYSQERSISYQLPFLNPDTDVDGLGNPIDSHATYHAAGRNSSAQLYMDNYGDVAAPAEQVTLFPQQTGNTGLGSLGMEWHEVEISKIGNTVDWKVDGVSLITLDSTNFVSQPAGGNILFGMSDINAGASADPLRFDLLFTLIDNVVVSTIDEPPAINADFNDDTNVDAADYVIWRSNEPIASGATQAQGDSDADGDVDGDDYTNWSATFGNIVPGSGAVLGASAAVPEPSATLLVLLGISTAACGRRRYVRDHR